MTVSAEVLIANHLEADLPATTAGPRFFDYQNAQQNVWSTTADWNTGIFDDTIASTGRSSVELASAPPFELCINSGGNDFTGADGTFYQQDAFFTGGGGPFSLNRPVNNTTDFALWRSIRYAFTAGGVPTYTYNIPVPAPGVYEVEQGVTTYEDLIYGDDYCQGMRDGHELKMFIPGGGSAPWLFPEHVSLPLEARPVGAAGTMLGSGAIVIMDDSTDAVKACLRVVRFFARESCGKCAPCREGTSWEEKILQRILDGNGRPEDIDLLLDVADNISPGPYPVASHEAEGLEAVPFPPRQTTICPLGPSSVAPITSAIRRFRHEFEAKIGTAVEVSA